MNNQDTTEDIVQNVVNTNSSTAQFSVANIPFHKHNGSDAPKVDAGNLNGIYVPVALTYMPSAAGKAILTVDKSCQHFIVMPAGNIMISLTGDTLNQIFYITITQDSVGSRTVTWFGGILWPNGTVPTLTTTPSKTDCFIFSRIGDNSYRGFVVGLNT